MLENKKVFIPKLGEEVHYSRIIASWRNEGGTGREQFIDWLLYWEVPDKTIDDILEMAECGKLELEKSVKDFIQFKNCNGVW